MKKDQNQKNYRFILTSFLFAIILAIHSSCLGKLSKSHIPQPIRFLDKLSKDQQEKYLELLSILKEDEEKINLEEKVSKLKEKEQIGAYINMRWTAESELLPCLPPSERNEVRKKLKEASDLKELQVFVRLMVNEFDSINQSSEQDLQYYRDLIELLPENQAIELKNAVVACKDPSKIGITMASILPPGLRLNNRQKEGWSIASEDEKKNVVDSALQNNNKENISLVSSAQTNRVEPAQVEGLPLGDSRVSNLPAEAMKHSPSFEPFPSIYTPIQVEKVKTKLEQLVEQKNETDENKPKRKRAREETLDDDWGPKLPLKGQERKDFLTTIRKQFDTKSLAKLKKVFFATDKKCIRNFLLVYNNEEHYKAKERKTLLSTIIALANADYSLCVSMCNGRLQPMQKLRIYCLLNGISKKEPEKVNLALLQRLQEALLALPD